jgi:hypothetical protein
MKIFLCSFITVRGLRYILYEEGWREGGVIYVCDFYVINIIVMQLIFIERVNFTIMNN